VPDRQLEPIGQQLLQHPHFEPGFLDAIRQVSSGGGLDVEAIRSDPARSS
jgi:hypothetical protein